jgi:hypothetical protein
MSRFWRPNASGQAHTLLLKWLYFGSQITFFNNYWPQKSFCLTKFLLNPILSNINAIRVWHCGAEARNASPPASSDICLLFCSRQREDVWYIKKCYQLDFRLYGQNKPINCQKKFLVFSVSCFCNFEWKNSAHFLRLQPYQYWAIYCTN